MWWIFISDSIYKLNRSVQIYLRRFARQFKNKLNSLVYFFLHDGIALFPRQV